MSVFTIIASGSSAQHWQPKGTCIGVNDAFKWGHYFDQLLLINNPKSFTADRLDLIRKTPHQKLWVHNDSWKPFFKEYELLRMQSFSKHLKKGHVYSSKTSPFVAMSLAFNQHATDIIIWGVDLLDHKVFHPGNKLQDYELRQYEKFCRLLSGHGCKVWLGAKGSALERFLNVWVEKVLV